MTTKIHKQDKQAFQLMIKHQNLLRQVLDYITITDEDDDDSE